MSVHEEDYKGYRIKIEHDDSPEDPRNQDNLGKMLCFHNRYTLGDKQEIIRGDDFDSWVGVAQHLKNKEDAVVILPLYLYDHSGLRIKVGNFNGLLPQGHAEFDSGQIGFIYATKKSIRENFGIKKVTAKAIEKTKEILTSEVDIYDDYLSGSVYGYTVELDGELIDSCWGFFGNYDGDVLAEAKSVIDYCTKPIEKKG